VKAVPKNEEIVEGLKKKYGVSSLKEFEKKIVSGGKPQLPRGLQR